MKSILFAAAFFAAEQDPDVTLPALDHAALFAADAKRMEARRPPHYSVPHTVKDLWVEDGESAGGAWTSEGPWRVWRARIVAKAATTVDLGFTDYWLPQGAELTLMDATGTVRHGPWGDSENQPHGEFWTPMVPGQEALLELRVPADRVADVRLALTRVNYGYRFNNEETSSKALSCNVDVICPAGDPYPDLIRSVAMYTDGAGNGVCSGSLINTTNRDGQPYFLTAEHCMGANPASYVFYFNYESDTCRTGGDSGVQLPREIGDAVSGSQLIAQSRVSDFALLELNARVPDEIEAFFSGWDRRGEAPEMGVNIHHPRTHEKRITIENDPVINGNFLVDIRGRPRLEPDTFWEVLRWDLGVTEGGSSGSPLYNEEQRIVGQLAGGAIFFCPGAEEGSDYFGKLSVAWDAEDAPTARLADWLDPGDTGAQFLDGTNGCDAPVPNAVVPATVAAGDLLTFGVSATGGQGEYSYDWDFDGDRRIDSRLQNSEVRYPNRVTTDVRVTVTVGVTDAAGCRAVERVAVRVEAPVIELASQAPVEACGDGDGLIERGEIWEFPVTLTNTGDRDANGAIAGFRVVGQSTAAKRTGGPDAFGYTFSDSDEANCAYSEVDLTTSAPVDLVAFDADFPPEDDGAAAIALATPFPFYGEEFATVSFATNGYLSTDPSDLGGDFDNDCPLPQEPSRGGGGRIMPLHDDLITEGGLFHASFDTCPRPAERGDPGQACEAFEWANMSYFSEPAADFNMQAFLYPATGDIAYQYKDDAFGDRSGSIAIMNPSFTDALTYACDDQPAPAAGSAVCITAPAPLSDAVTLLTPTLSFDTIPANGARSGSVQVLIEDDIPCGSGVRIDFAGVGHAGGFAGPGNAVPLSLTVADGDCATAATACPVPAAPDFLPREGFYFNADRGGNGIEVHFANGGLYGAWYTAERGGRPTWYYVQTLESTPLSYGQISASLLSFTGPIEGPPTFEIVGDATFNFLDPTSALLTWTIDDEPGGELLTYFDLGDPTGVPAAVTDQWFDDAEPGWGLGIQQQNDLEFTAVYFYATDDLPAWVVSTDPTGLASGASPVAVAEVHCPGCVWSTPELSSAGTLERSFASDTSGTLTLDASTDLPLSIRWQRTDIAIGTVSGGR
ncbi:MAG: hypothetical protein AAGE01_07945 [Pseudomonadota bacterium]